MTTPSSSHLARFCSSADDEDRTAVMVTQRYTSSLLHARLHHRLRILAGLLLVSLMLLRVASAAENTLSADIRSRPIQRNIQFSTLSISNGLSQATVNAIAQDQHGFIWIGTQEGLNRYDGYEFKVYLRDAAEPNSLSNDWVWTVFADAAGGLWIGTDGGGLSRYEPNTDSFIHYRHDPNDPSSISGDRVRVIYQDKQGILWIGTDGNGLNRFDPEGGSFEHYRHDPQVPDSLANDKVLAILEDRTGVLWVGTDGGGLNRFARGSGKFSHYRHDDSRPDSLSDDRIRDIYEDRNGQLWIGTYSRGIDLFNPVTGSFKHFQFDPSNPYSLSHNEVRRIYQDRDGAIWVATDGGLNEWRPEIQGFISNTHDPVDPSSIASNRVISIFQDRGNVLWFGTYNGISRWNYISDAFTYYKNQQDGQLGLSDNLVSGFGESPDGLIWIGTYGGGLNRLDPVSGEIVSFQHDPMDQNSLSDNRVMTVFADQHGSIWVGTRNGGLNRLDTATGIFVRYQHDPLDQNSLSSDGVTSVYGDGDGILWIGTYGGGLNRFDPNSGEFRVFRYDPNVDSSLSSDRVLSIVRSTAGTLWIGTEDGGLNEFNEANSSFTQYRHDPTKITSLSSDTAWEVVEGRDGSLWIGSRDGGLNRWLPEDRKAGKPAFNRYGKSDGLVSNTIYGILEDDDGALWLSGSRGLSRFDPESGDVRHFDKKNGLQGYEFNFGARLRSMNGSLLFGGTDGVVMFHPKQIRFNLLPPPVTVTAFSRLSPIASGHSNDSKPASVTMGYRDYSISFEFTALDYTSSDKNQYRYMLEGFDNDWINSGRFRRATYTNLPAGNYTFKVKASNNDGVWSQDNATIKLQVTPPPWKTGWAYAGYILLILLVSGAVVRNQINKLQQATMHRKELERQVKLRTLELAERNQELEKLTAQLEKASVTDPLTGLHNRRYLHQYMDSEIAALYRYDQDHPAESGTSPAVDLSPGLSFMMIDLDGFKPINDTYGHHAGDLALMQVRDILQDCCRKSDTIVRWGGDEFFIVGRHASRFGAERYAERIRAELAKHQFQVGAGHVARLSGSIGVTMYPFAPHKQQQLSWEQVTTIADQAAYLAKENGRNAWVGLYGTRKISSEEFYERLNTDLEGLVNQGMVDVNTSIEHALVFSSRVQQRNASC